MLTLILHIIRSVLTESHLHFTRNVREMVYQYNIVVTIGIASEFTRVAHILLESRMRCYTHFYSVCRIVGSKTGYTNARYIQSVVLLLTLTFNTHRIDIILRYI